MYVFLTLLDVSHNSEVRWESTLANSSEYTCFMSVKERSTWRGKCYRFKQSHSHQDKQISKVEKAFKNIDLEYCCILQGLK